MDYNILEYEITENQLTSGRMLKGKVLHQQVITNARLVEEMVRRNSTVTRQEALAVLDLYEELVREALKKGNTVSTGLFRADISMSGGFGSYDDRIDYKKHKAKIVIRPAIHLNREVCRYIRFNKSRKTSDNFNISFVTDFPGGDDRQLTTGAVIRIRGRGLKSYKHENGYELYLEAPDRSRTELRLITAAFKSITALLPPDIKPGTYTLRIIHRYGSVERVFERLNIRVKADHQP